MMNAAKILDACCSSRAFWYDKENKNTVFMDNRLQDVVINRKGIEEILKIRPTVQASFTDIPFKSDTFDLVVFDPPHLRYPGSQSWLCKRYGELKEGWEHMLAAGFSECFRVLRLNGTLIFKWSELDITVSKVLKLTSVPPLFGRRSGKRMGTHWIAFIKTESVLTPELEELLS